MFNPSIVNIQNETYLVSYRYFYRKDNKHPSETNWQYGIGGFDKTYFAFISINDDGVKLNKLITNNSIENFVDARLFKYDKKYVIIYSAKIVNNIYVGSKVKKYITNNDQINCVKDGCTLQIFRTFEIENDDIKFLKGIHPYCSDLSSHIEKNWSVFGYNNELYITYGFAHSPNNGWFNKQKKIDFLNMKVKEPKECDIVKPVNNPNINFVKIQEIFKGLHISCSTPAILSNINKDTWISVGHVKFDVNDKNECLKSFIDFINSKNLNHNKFHYASFFYKFVRISNKKYNTEVDYLIEPMFKIIEVSKLFLISDTNHSIMFPCGITYLNDDLLISYGEGDKKCKLALFKESEIEWIKDDINSCNDWKLMFVETS